LAEAPTNSRLRRLIEPKSIAIVGASPKSGGARQALANLLEMGFSGPLAAVNPRHVDVLGVRCVPRLKDLDYVPDAVLVALGARDSLPVLRSAAELGVGGVVVVATGYADAGLEGAALQTELVEIATSAQMPVIGPNCQGTINFALPSALYLRHVQPYKPGSVGVISQSGLVTTAIVNSRIGLRFRHVISTGNEAVTTSADLVEFFVDDPEVATIVLFLEHIREPARFFAACDRAAANGKPVVVLKAGRTEAAREAIVSHSGVLSPPDRLVDAALKAHGVIRVDSLEDLLGTALAVGGRPAKGNRVAAITISGGHIELLHDHAASAGIAFPHLDQRTLDGLREVLPPSLRPGNPLDAWGLENPEKDFARCVSLVSRDPNIDIIVVMAEPWQHPTGDVGAHQLYIDSARAVAAETEKVVVLLASASGAQQEFAEEMAADGVLALAGIRDGLRCLGHLSQTERQFRHKDPAVITIDAGLVDAELGRLGDQPVSGQAVLHLLSSIGIPIARTYVATSADAAVQASRELGWPVAVKSGDPHLAHKLEAAAVVLDLDGDLQVMSAAEAILAAGHGPLLVQPMVQNGVEVILGIVSDQELGAFVVVGAGGSWAEALDDVSIRAVPLDVGEAEAMIKALRAWPLLTGGRGRQPLDVSALCRAVDALSAFGARFGDRIDALEINPLFAIANGVVAVDALLVPRRPSGGS